MPSRMVHRSVQIAAGSSSTTKSPAQNSSASSLSAVTPRPNRRRPLSALEGSNPAPVMDLRKWFQPQPTPDKQPKL